MNGGCNFKKGMLQWRGGVTSPSLWSPVGQYTSHYWEIFRLAIPETFTTKQKQLTTKQKQSVTKPQSIFSNELQSLYIKKLSWGAIM